MEININFPSGVMLKNSDTNGESKDVPKKKRGPKPKKKANLQTFNIDDATMDRLEDYIRLENALNTNKSEIVRLALREYLDKLEKRESEE